MATAQATKNNITLKGSTAIVTEFFGYAVNSILYQRGIYSPETFERKQKYGLGMLVTTDESLKVRSERRSRSDAHTRGTHTVGTVVRAHKNTRKNTRRCAQTLPH